MGWSPPGNRQRQAEQLPTLLASGSGREAGLSPQLPWSRGGAAPHAGDGQRPWTTGTTAAGGLSAAESRRPTLTPSSRQEGREARAVPGEAVKKAFGGRGRLRSAALQLLKKDNVKIADPAATGPRDSSAAPRYSDEVHTSASAQFAASPPPQGLTWHAYLCHSPTNGVDQAIVLNQALAARCAGLSVCFRFSAGNQLSAREVREVVPGCAALVLVLTTGVLARPDVQARACRSRGRPNPSETRANSVAGACVISHHFARSLSPAQLAVKLAMAQRKRICLLHDTYMDTGGISLQEIQREGGL